MPGPGASVAGRVTHLRPCGATIDAAPESCRESRPDTAFLGSRPRGMEDFPLSPHDQHQLAALTLGLLALPYAQHRDFREEWRP